MYVIVGLGNPEDKYAGTRHNIGFDVINYFAESKNIEMKKRKHKAIIGEGFIGREKVMLVKPQTFMNLSGESVVEIVDYYDVPLENLLVIYDDIDLEGGSLRLRRKGSAGTHNGMRSIIYQLQDDKFPRLRVGIGRPERGDLIDFVIGRFSEEERKYMGQAVKKAAQAVDVFITKGITETMNQFNG